MSEIFGAIKLKNKIVIASSMAILAVVLAVTIGILGHAMADRHTHIYEYGLEKTEEGGFNLVGVCTVDNCESPYYREMGITDVKILSAVSPTCTKEGNRVYTYNYNGTTIKYTEQLPKEAHIYDFELVESNDVKYLNGRCQNPNCEDPHIFVDNIEEIKLVSSVPGTCFSPRKDTYVYIVDDQEYSFTTLVEEDIPHTLNLIPANSYEDKDGNYPIGTKGVKILGDEKIACGATGNGYYICEMCKQVVVVTVARPEHKFVYNEEDLTPPTTTTAGLATLKCHNTECTEKREVVLPVVEIGSYTTVVSEATELHPQIVKYSFKSNLYGFTFEKEYEIGETLDHDYKYHIEPGINDNGKMDLVGVCGQPECQTPEIREENIETTFVNTSTCVTLGEIIWSYEYNGEILTFTLPSPDYDKHTYTYHNSRAEKPTLTREGFIEIYCTTEGCDHAVLVVLPKVVIGENVEFVDVAPNGAKLYSYTYKTEYNCTIELDVLIEE